jgi:hypothetical protein
VKLWWRLLEKKTKREIKINKELNIKETKMNYNELINTLKAQGIDYADVEVYGWVGKKHDFHTDSIKSIDYEAISEVYDYQVMDADDYNSTVLANTGEKFEDMYEDGDKVLVVIAESSGEVRERVYDALAERNILNEWNAYAKNESPLSLTEFINEVMEEFCENGFIEMRKNQSKDGCTHLFSL